MELAGSVMKYKTGDKVILREELIKWKDKSSGRAESPGINPTMLSYFGKVVTISPVATLNNYIIEEDGRRYSYKESWFESALEKRKVTIGDLV